MDDDDSGEMIRDLVRKFVQKELLPLEKEFLQRQSQAQYPSLAPEHSKRLHAQAKEIGLWGLDAPESMGGHDLPASVMIGVTEELARTVIPFRFAPDSPNLRMLEAVGTEAQKEKYLQGYIEGTLNSAIAISEPGAGGDPAAMQTRAVLDGDQWVINGRKIWISNMNVADFVIVMARVGEGKRHEGITAFIIDKGTPGFIMERPISMIGNSFTHEIVFEDCRIPKDAVLGEVGKGYAPMQLRLLTRRFQMGSTAIGRTQRALDMMSEHAKQRVTFGVPLAERQAIQWWIADTETKLHACRLMVRDIAAKIDRGEDVRHEASMIKIFATEMAYDTIDHAMQTLGALGMTTETALFSYWMQARVSRIYEGPSEVHRQAIARNVLKRYG